MRQLKHDNKGMTLVELMVSIAVLAILMSGVFGLMRAASTYHANSSREVELQNQMQTTFTQVSNILVDAKAVSFGSNRLVACKEDVFYVVEKDGTKLYAYEGNGTSDPNYAAAASKDEKLAYAASKAITKNNNCLISDKVSFFQVVTDNYESTGFVVLAIKCEYNSRDAYMSKNVFLRNTAGSIISNAGGTGTPGAGSPTAGTPTAEATPTTGGGTPGGDPATPTPTIPYNTPTTAPTTAPATPTPTPNQTQPGEPSKPSPVNYGGDAGGVHVTIEGSEWWDGNNCNVNISLSTGRTSGTITIVFDKPITSINCWFGSYTVSGNVVTIHPFDWFWYNPSGGFSLTAPGGAKIVSVTIS